MTIPNTFPATCEPFTDKFIQRNISPAVLAKLFHRAQQANPKAISILCRAFGPIVTNAYRQSTVRSILGDDAVDIAWEIFLSFVHTYHGNNFTHLPGLVKKHLHDRLNNALHRAYYQTDKENVNSDALVDTAAEYPALEELHANAGFFKLLEGCKPKQIRVAKMLYMYCLPETFIAQLLHCTNRNIYKINKQILLIARQNALALGIHR